MSWPQYDPTRMTTSTGSWSGWADTKAPARWGPESREVARRDLTPVTAVFPVLDLLGIATPTVPLLDLKHSRTALFYASGDALSDAVVDGEVREQDLRDLEDAHGNGPVTVYDKRAVVARGRVLRYWRQARGSSEPLTFFVPPTVHGGDALQFTTHWSPQWELAAAVVLSARMCTPVLVGSRARPPAPA